MSRVSRTRCYIGRLKEGAVGVRDLDGLFSRFGRIVDVQVKGNYGFVEFDTDAAADAAVYEMNRREFMGDRLIVEHAKDDSKVRRGPPPRVPSPRRYDMPPLLNGGSYGSSYAPVPPSYGSSPYNQYSRYPPNEPLPPYRPFEPEYPRRNSKAWSPPRGPVRRRSRSRSRSPYRGAPKRSRRSSPLRVRRRSRSPSKKNTGQLSKTTQRSSWRICIENLALNATWQDLMGHFDEIGEVYYASVASDASGFVEFSKRSLVYSAVEKLNNTVLRGIRIQVINAIPPDEDVPQEGDNDEAPAEESEEPRPALGEFSVNEANNENMESPAVAIGDNQNGEFYADNNNGIDSFGHDEPILQVCEPEAAMDA